MDNTITLILKRFFTQIIQFLKHWYIKSTKIYWHFIINQFEKIDYKLAWKITFKNLFKVLYGDNSIIGHIIGFPLRLSRLFLGSIIYLILFTISAIIYLFWIFLPIILIYKIFTS